MSTYFWNGKEKSYFVTIYVHGCSLSFYFKVAKVEKKYESATPSLDDEKYCANNKEAHFPIKSIKFQLKKKKKTGHHHFKQQIGPSVIEMNGIIWSSDNLRRNSS